MNELSIAMKLRPSMECLIIQKWEGNGGCFQDMVHVASEGATSNKCIV